MGDRSVDAAAAGITWNAEDVTCSVGYNPPAVLYLNTTEDVIALYANGMTTDQVFSMGTTLGETMMANGAPSMFTNGFTIPADADFCSADNWLWWAAVRGWADREPFASGTYVATDTSAQTVSLGFKPRMIWLINETQVYWMVWTYTMADGVGTKLYVDGVDHDPTSYDGPYASADATTGTHGFTIPATSGIAAGDTVVWLAWR
jgi:hypothetical protein